MKNIEHLTVAVTYRVGLRNLNMPNKVYSQMIKAYENGDEVEMSAMPKYPDALGWLQNHIKERDCMDWSAEIVDINAPDNET